MMDDFDSDSSAGSTTSSPAQSGGSSSSKSSSSAGKKARKAGEAAGQSMNQWGVDELREQAREASERIPSYKRGGTKRGAGKAHLHKSERIMAPKRKKSKRMGRGRGGR